jgi:hypothetical protein
MVTCGGIDTNLDFVLIVYPHRHLAAQRRSPILRYPDQMQMDLENVLRAVSVGRLSPTTMVSPRTAREISYG